VEPSGVVSGRIQTSGSALHDEKFREASVAAKYALYAAPEHFKPYKALHMIISFPLSSFPNYLPAVVYSFSAVDAFKYSFQHQASSSREHLALPPRMRLLRFLGRLGLKC
jgi:hypothetical protein